ncbi:MAG: anti-sigma factor family protein [Acidothermaceae bacterium]
MNTPHPEPETLAELADMPDQADVSAEIPADVSDHVASCEQCTRDVAALRRLRQTLRSLPPVAMPDEIAARIESALGAEVDAARAEKPAAAAISVLPSRADRSQRLSGRRFAHFPAAAAIAVLAVVVVGTGIAAVVTSSGGTKQASKGASSAIAGDRAVVLASGNDYDKNAIRNQVAAVVLSHVPGGAQLYKGLTPLASGHVAAAAGGSAPEFNAPAASPSAAASAATAAPAVSAGAQAPSASAFGTKVTAPTAPSGPLASNAALQACIVALVGQSVTPVLVDYAIYDGQPATIIVLTDPTIPNTLDLYVEYYTADCAKDGDVSFFATLPTS